MCPRSRYLISSRPIEIVWLGFRKRTTRGGLDDWWARSGEGADRHVAVGIRETILNLKYLGLG